ncbi:Cation transport regulator ChaB [compost metagenome]
MLQGSSKKPSDKVQRTLPRLARAIYKAAFDKAYSEYMFLQDRLDDANRKEMADRIAWKKVKRTYSFSDFDHHWHLKV